jgi:hypothetical protein
MLAETGAASTTQVTCCEERGHWPSVPEREQPTQRLQREQGGNSQRIQGGMQDDRHQVRVMHGPGEGGAVQARGQGVHAKEPARVFFPE